MDIYIKKGHIHEIFDTNVISDKFMKREFILLERNDTGNGTYTEHIRFQCTNNNVQLMNDIAKKDLVTIKFSIRGREYEKDGKKMYFTNLEVEDMAIINKHASGPVEIKANDINDYSDILPGLDDGSVDLQGIGGPSNEPEINFDDLPF